MSLSRALATRMLQLRSGIDADIFPYNSAPPIVVGIFTGDEVLTFFFFASRSRNTRCLSDWSSDVCSSDLTLIDVFRENPAIDALVFRHRARIEPFEVRLERLQSRDLLIERSSSDVVENIIVVMNADEIGRASCRERV